MTAERRTRLTLAAENHPRVHAGRTKCLHVSPPEAGRMRHHAAKKRIARRPDQNVGVDWPRRAAIMAIRSNRVLRRIAARIPAGKPISTASTIALRARISVAGSRSTATARAGKLNRSDSPKSPRLTRCKKARYCSGMDRSNP
jgi:hypothetical protein